MKRMLLAAVAAIALHGAAYADTIKVGVVGPFSGPFAIQGKNFKAGIDAWMALNGAKVGDDDGRDPLPRHAARPIRRRPRRWRRTWSSRKACSISPASTSRPTPWP